MSNNAPRDFTVFSTGGGEPPRAWFAKAEVQARADLDDGHPPRRGFAPTGEERVTLTGIAVLRRTAKQVVVPRGRYEAGFRTHLAVEDVDFTPEAAWERERARARDELVAAERAMECARRRLALLEGPMPEPKLVNDMED